MKNSWLTDFIRLLFPPCCVVCEDALSIGEECLCLKCLLNMPKTNYHLVADNELEKRFWGKFPIERASAYFHYVKGSDFDKILFELKYHGQKEVGEYMGRYMANDLLVSGFFNEIDIIVPVPLHKKREKERGYNQSEWIARGIEQVTGIEVCTEWLYHSQNTKSQTGKNIYERWLDTRTAYETDSELDLSDKHILLVDDVVTTGATLLACAQALYLHGKPRISCLTLAAVL